MKAQTNLLDDNIPRTIYVVYILPEKQNYCVLYSIKSCFLMDNRKTKVGLSFLHNWLSKSLCVISFKKEKELFPSVFSSPLLPL